MTIQDILDAELSDSLKVAMMRIFTLPSGTEMFQNGGNVDKSDHATKENKQSGKTITPTQTISIEDFDIDVAIAKTRLQKEIGLSEVDYLPDGCGMLFVYEYPQKNLIFTMADTSIDLDIIFIDENGVVTSVNHCKAFDENPIKDKAKNAQFVLEVNINSGIQIGDELDEYNDEEEIEDEEEPELTELEKQKISKSKMLVLDENGDVQMRLEGGERIFSRKLTKRIIKLALKAYEDEEDIDFIKLGKMVFKELDALDNRKPEYVDAPK